MTTPTPIPDQSVVFLRTGPLPGEEVCLECQLPDCIGEAAESCPLRQRRTAWRNKLKRSIEHALKKPNPTFTLPVHNSGQQYSVYIAARSLVPKGTRVHTELDHQDGSFLLTVSLTLPKTRKKAK